VTAYTASLAAANAKSSLRELCASVKRYRSLSTDLYCLTHADQKAKLHKHTSKEALARLLVCAVCQGNGASTGSLCKDLLPNTVNLCIQGQIINVVQMTLVSIGPCNCIVFSGGQEVQQGLVQATHMSGEAQVPKATRDCMQL